MKNRYAEITVGIYETEMALKYGRKYATLVLPYVKWNRNTGCLRFRKCKFDRIADAKQIEKLDLLFLNYDNNPSSLRDYLAVNFGW